MGCIKSKVRVVDASATQQAENAYTNHGADSTIEEAMNAYPNTPSDNAIIAQLFGAKDCINLEVVDPQAFNSSFIQQRQQAMDNRSYRSTIESWHSNSLEQLVTTIKTFAQGKSIIDRHWVIFYWIACNIKYDTVAFFSKNYKDQSALGVFREKKGVCAGYANIYKYLCDQLQMPCEVVSGYAKGYGFDDREGAPTETNHAWNVVEIDRHWYLMESTWGAGSLNKHKAFERKLKAYYFLARPNEMIYHHLPENERWQLLKTPIQMQQYMQMPKLSPLYFELNLELISPCNQVHVDLLSEKSYALVLVRAPSDVDLIANLQLKDREIDGGHRVIFDQEKKVYCCYFAPAEIGKHKVIICGKRGNSENANYQSAIELILNIKQMPTNSVSFPRTWKSFFDFGLEVISPQNTHVIKLNNKVTCAQILIKAPENVELLGKLNNENEQEVKNGNQVYYDRRNCIWRCNFAPDRDGKYQAYIMAREKSDSSHYTSTILFNIEAEHIPSPNISYPYTWPRFYDLDLNIEAPQNRGNAVWADNASYAEVLIKAPDDVQLSCHIAYNDVKIENGSLAQFNHEKKLWQLLFAPERTGQNELIVFAKRSDDKESSARTAVKFTLNVDKLRRPMKFPSVYTRFEATKCQILTPIDGILKKGSIVPIHCVIPGAVDVDVKVDSQWQEIKSYTDSILQTQVTVGSKEVTIYAKYEQNSKYNGLVKYTVQ